VEVQRQKDGMRRTADDAQATRQEAMQSAQRVLECVHALERPLGELVQTLREEMDRAGPKLPDGARLPFRRGSS
jgi:hypothetical protein